MLYNYNQLQAMNIASQETLLLKDINRRIDSFIPLEAWQSTVGILIVIGTELHQFGTGTLFRIADQCFIVTAGHVIKEAHKYDKSLCVTGPNCSFVRVHGNWICSAEGQYGTFVDPFDVAVLPLDSAAVDRLSDKLFLRLDDASFSKDLSSAIFCLFGYPALLSQPSTNPDTRLLLKPFQYATYAFEGPTDALGGYQPRFHLLLGARLSESTDIDGKPISFRDRQGTPVEFPRGLRGISGCSVWKIGDRRRPMEEWNKKSPRIVAVQTSVYHDHQIIKATRWVAVSTLLHEAFPELRPAMALWRVG